MEMSLRSPSSPSVEDASAEVTSPTCREDVGSFLAEPCHRFRAAGRSCLLRRSSPYANGPQKSASSLRMDLQAVSYQGFDPVRNWEAKEDLYEPCPEEAVECDACGKRWPSSQGHLCGEKGVPWSVRFRFICVKCNPRRRCSGPDCGVVHSPPTEETLTPAVDDTAVEDDRISEDSWDGLERTISQEEEQGRADADSSENEEDTRLNDINGCGHEAWCHSNMNSFAQVMVGF